MKSIILFFTYSIIAQLGMVFNSETTEHSLEKPLVKIEILNEEAIDFPFSIKYEPFRKQIHVRSDVPIRTMRLLEEEKAQKSYMTIGSNLVNIPLQDFVIDNDHILEIKFIDSDLIVEAKVQVLEEH